MTHDRQEARSDKGFTLVEVLVGLVVFGLIMTTTTGILFNIQRSWLRQRDDLLCIDNTRWALEFMAGELRRSGGHVITPGVGDRIKFDLDTDGDSSADTTIWYWRGNSTSDTVDLGDSSYLYRGIGNGLGQAYAVRQELANFVINNPANADIFSESGGAITLQLTCGKGTRSYYARTAVRPRN